MTGSFDGSADRVAGRLSGLLKGTPVDGFEVFLIRSSRFSVEAKEGKVDALQASGTAGVAVRVLREGRPGFSYLTFGEALLSDEPHLREALARLVDDAVSSAATLLPDPCYDFPPIPEAPVPELPLFDESLESVAEGVKIAMARQLEASARSVDPGRVTKVRRAAYGEAVTRKILINSLGLYASWATTHASLGVTAVATEGGASEAAWEGETRLRLEELDPVRIGESAGRAALGKLGGKPVPSGRYPVLLVSRVAAEFLSLLVSSFLADQIQKGKSLLRGKMGERVFASAVSILDDGLLPGGVASSPFDGEGTPSRRTSLVRCGVVEGFLYDRYRACRERRIDPSSKAASTGSSRRTGIGGPPGVGPSNLFIEPGRRLPEALLKDQGRGIVIEEVMGLHTVDPVSGDFSLGCSGTLVERGEGVHPVRSVAVAGNLLDLFDRVAEAGSDLRFWGGTGAPSLLVEGMELSGK